MRPTSVTSTVFGLMIALTLSEAAFATTYNFYFPKRGGAPEVELADEENSVGDSTLSDERDVEDDEPVYVEEVAPVVKPKRRIVMPPAMQVPYCASGTVVIPPVIIHGNRSPKFTESEYVDPDDLMSGTNTTPGHTLSPRRRVVRRTILIER